jgi:dihydrofolate synthase / folylpolyglutamate synthase
MRKETEFDNSHDVNSSDDKQGIKKSLDYLYGLKQFRNELKLDRVKELIESLGNPYKNYKTIHVAGTNGKGSTCALIARILEKAGHKVGLYTSPHLVNYNERIQINRQQIDDQDLIRIMNEIKIVVEKEKLETTFFEMSTVIAFQYFEEKKVDIAVIEVGLGGRLDATNVISPCLTIITNIDFDHVNILGNTIKKIAFEKAGIIKQNVPLITAESKKSALQIFKEQCFLKSAPLLIAKETEFETSLLGSHQKKNVACAVLAVKKLIESGMQISQDNIVEGLKETKWPGRLEMISDEPLIIVDCAHNMAGMIELVNYVKEIDSRKILVFGLSTGKNIEEIVKLICPLFEKIIVTEGSYRAIPANELVEVVKKYSKDCQIIINNKEAINQAKLEVKDNELILITGSMYLVGDILKQF